MPNIQLTDAAFEAARARAVDAGFASVDAYVEDMVLDGGVADDEGDDFDADRFFTPERLAQIEKGQEDVRAGRVFTLEQVDAELAKRREAWLKANGR